MRVERVVYWSRQCLRRIVVCVASGYCVVGRVAMRRCPSHRVDSCRRVLVM